MIEAFPSIARIFAIALVLTLALPAAASAQSREPAQSRATASRPGASYHKATRLAASPGDSEPEPATSDSRARTMLLVLAALVALFGIATLGGTVAAAAITAALTGLMLMFPFVLTGPTGHSIAEVLNPVALAILAALLVSRIVSQILKHRRFPQSEVSRMRLSERHTSG